MVSSMNPNEKDDPQDIGEDTIDDEPEEAYFIEKSGVNDLTTFRDE